MYVSIDCILSPTALRSPSPTSAEQKISILRRQMTTTYKELKLFSSQRQLPLQFHIQVYVKSSGPVLLKYIILRWMHHMWGKPLKMSLQSKSTQKIRFSDQSWN